jgi:hypothetical protein
VAIGARRVEVVDHRVVDRCTLLKDRKSVV